MSVNRCILFNTITKRSDTVHYSMKNPENIQGKKPDTKGHVLYHLIYSKHPGSRPVAARLWGKTAMGNILLNGYGVLFENSFEIQ